MQVLFRIAVLGAFAAGGSPAFAQAAAPAPTTGAGAVVATSPGDATGKRAMERVERHINDLHKRLAITPAQQTQWAAFADVMRQNARRMEASYTDRQARPGATTAVEDLRTYATMERARADDVERLVPVFDALYQAMTPEQRVAADKTFNEFQRGGRGKNRT